MSASEGARAFDVVWRLRLIVRNNIAGRPAISTAEEADERRNYLSMLRLAESTGRNGTTGKSQHSAESLFSALEPRLDDRFQISHF